MLKIQVKGSSEPPQWLVEKLFSIGSASTNNLVLDDAEVDPLHARLVNNDGHIFLRDNNSRSGSYINGQRVTLKELYPGDELRLGSTVIQVESAEQLEQSQWRLVADNWLAGKSFAVPDARPAVVGRDSGCDIVIAGTHLSRRHAELKPEGQFLRIRDLGSVNGTYLNDKPVANVLARNGDRVRMDVYSFRLVAPHAEQAPTRPREILQSLPEVEAVPERPADRPRRWITKPTSPGNRQEPTYEEPEKDHSVWLWLLLLAATLGFIATVTFW